MKKKRHRKRKGADGSSWSRRRNQKSSTLTVLWHLAQPVKNNPGIIVRQHLIVQRQVVLLKERYAESRKELLRYCCNQAWTENGGQIPWSVAVIWETPSGKGFGEPCKRPVISFGSMVEYHPISAKDQSRLHQLGKKVLPGIFLGYALYAEGIWKGDILVADLEELENLDAPEIYTRRLNAKEVITPKKVRI